MCGRPLIVTTSTPHPLRMMHSLYSNFPAQAIVGHLCVTSPVTFQLSKWRSKGYWYTVSVQIKAGLE